MISVIHLELLISAIIIVDISNLSCRYQQFKLLISVIVNKSWFGPPYMYTTPDYGITYT